MSRFQQQRVHLRTIPSDFANKVETGWGRDPEGGKPRREINILRTYVRIVTVRFDGVFLRVSAGENGMGVRLRWVRLGTRNHRGLGLAHPPGIPSPLARRHRIVPSHAKAGYLLLSHDPCSFPSSPR